MPPGARTDVQPHSASNSAFRAWLLSLSSVCAVAFTIWIARGSVFLIEWNRSSVQRVGYLPEVDWTMRCAGVGVALLVGCVLAMRTAGSAAAALARDLAPLQLLWLCVLPYVPWVADELPWLMVLAQPIRWLVATTAVGLVGWGMARRRGWRPSVPAPGATTVGVVTFALLLTVGSYVHAYHGFGGDEPHYLVIAHSLFADRDLDIENNHRAGDYKAFFGGELAPDYLKRGRHDVIYSVHAPGLPALVLPAYALAGARGAMVMVMGFAALAAAGVFVLARAIAGARAAMIVWAGTALTMPFFMHGWMLYPELPAACVTAWATGWLWRDDDEASAATWAGRGVSLAVLPWLHTKFVILLAGFGLGLGLRLLARRRIGALAALSLPVAVSVAGWFAFFWVLYGVADPNAPYGGASAQGAQLSWQNLPRSLAGLFFDQEYGLLPHAPWYAMALLGVASALRSRQHVLAVGVLLLTVAAFLAGSGRYYMWWGGWSVPARFMVPLLPMATPFIALGVARLRGEAARGAAALVLLASVACTAILLARPDRLLMYNDRDGSGKLAELAGGAPLVTSLPSMLLPDWHAQLPYVYFSVAACAVAFLGLWWASRPGRLAPPNAVALLVCGWIFGTAAAARAFEPRVAYDRLVSADRLSFLNQADDERRGLVDYSRPGRTTVRRLLPALSVRIWPPNIGVQEAVTALGPVALPPGSYVATAWLDGRVPPDGSLLATWHPGLADVGRVDGDLSSFETFEFKLPAQFEGPPIWFGADRFDVSKHLQHVDVRPVTLVPDRLRGHLRPHTIEPLHGARDAALAYVDDEAYPEGGVFWTRNTSTAHVFVVPGEARVLRVKVQTGAVPGTLTFSMNDATHSDALAPWTVTVAAEVQLPRDGAPVRLGVGFSKAFRPSDVDTSSHDERLLGVRVFVELE